MCAGCVMAAMAGASGTRSWLQNHRLSWLTPKRLRAATASMFVVAFGISSVGLSGSTPPRTPPPRPRFIAPASPLEIVFRDAQVDAGPGGQLAQAMRDEIAVMYDG